MEPLDIIGEKWDCLIILDACRYDYFEQVWGDYLEGELSRRQSVGSSTNEWRNKSFTGRYDDIVYITANPQISASSHVYGFCAGEHFHAVHEVWKTHWVRGTVPPEAVTAAAARIIANTPGKRFIVHYIQPHAPYLSLGEDARGYEHADINAPRHLVGVVGGAARSKTMLYRLLLPLCRCTGLLGNHPDWMLRKWLNMPPKAPMEVVLRRHTVEQLREAYRDNLQRVLVQTALLIKQLSGRIIVTSDHGELLGEDRCFSHPTGSDHPILRQVPWLVIDKTSADASASRIIDKVADRPQSSPPPACTQDERELTEKLKALGYLD
ncbi:MAG: hypothetical protein IH624_09060 [Phycisphaerae bacterium]|nr:hypothetical protein [Phycisphaerae bacterium]